MKKKPLIIFGLLVIIVGLAVITNWRFKKWREDFRRGEFSKLESLGLNIDEFGEISSTEETVLQKFASQDGKFAIGYPVDWAAIEQPEILKAMSPENLTEKYGLQTLLFALKTDGESSQLVVYKGNFGLDAQGIIEELKKATQVQGWKMNVISSEIKEETAIFEAGYETSSGLLFHSKEKIIITGDETYLITALVSEINWLGVEKDIDKIISSAIIMETK